MVETVQVTLSGTALSLLLYEVSRSTIDQEGFLIGDLHQTSYKTVTDSDSEVTNRKRIIYINSYLPYMRSMKLYDAYGSIDTNVLNKLLGDQKTKVIGWYKYRHGVGFRTTMRDVQVHKSLMKIFEVMPIGDLFTFGLLISSGSDNASTHEWSQKFLRYVNKSFVPIVMHITNLNEPKGSCKVNDEVAKILLDFEKESGKSDSEVVIGINNALQKSTGKVVNTISVVDEELFELESEVRELLEKIRLRDNFGIKSNVKLVNDDNSSLESHSDND